MNDLTKLPKWAQEHIAKLEREREMALRQLNEFCDNQTPSNLWVEDSVCTGEQQGPTNKRMYIQGDTIYASVDGKEFYIRVREHGRWNPEPSHLYVSGNHSALAIKPSASNCIQVTQE